MRYTVECGAQERVAMRTPTHAKSNGETQQPRTPMPYPRLKMVVTHPLHEAAEGLVELDAELALALLLPQLVRVVVGAVAALERLRRRDDLGEELQVLELRTGGCAEWEGRGKCMRVT